MTITQEKKAPFWSVMFAIFLGVFLGTFNMSAINIALPIFIKSFNSSLDSVKMDINRIYACNRRSMSFSWLFRRKI